MNRKTLNSLSYTINISLLLEKLNPMSIIRYLRMMYPAEKKLNIKGSVSNVI